MQFRDRSNAKLQFTYISIQSILQYATHLLVISREHPHLFSPAKRRHAVHALPARKPLPSDS